MCRPKRRTRSQARNKHPRSQNKNRVRGRATHPTLKHRGRLKTANAARILTIPPNPTQPHP
ncbi:hypothetical protein [Kingella potus]|uniref:hypothetical protein n=1 Tax=Kingella potus TaxID=265175 RepID=UPI001FCF9535|nr:hypothetical protein [Kingella potus]UOP00197.1 hypothetical protein LVJ84_09680 [Kingella potus]